MAKSLALPRLALAFSALCVLVVGITLLVAKPPATAPKKPPTAAAKPSATAKPSDPFFEARVVPFLKKHCLECHGDVKPKGELALTKYRTSEDLIKDRSTWEKVLELVQTEAMPPANRPEPDPKERQVVTDWLDATLFKVDCRDVKARDPGRVTIRRLNRAEYNNTVRDLTGVDFKPADDFPSDDVGYGFDSIGDVLSLPPLLMEKYLDAADKIAHAVVEQESSAWKPKRFEGDRLKLKGNANEYEGVFALLSGDALVTAELEIPKEGEYTLRALAGAQQAGPETAKMEFRIDGKKVKVFDVKPPREAQKPFETREMLTAGKHKFSIAFINDFYDEKSKDRKNRDRNLFVTWLEIQGGQTPNETTQHLVMTCHPEPGKASRTCYQQILKPFLSRAFRAPVADADAAKFVTLALKAELETKSFERGLEVALQASLVSPRFLFRIEQDLKPNDPAERRVLADYELATRMSYFLWSTLPDKELFDLAAKNTLHEDAVLQQQVTRMLRDPRSQALVDNFFAQWLQLRNLDDVSPDVQKFPEWSDGLRADMRKETELFCSALVHENGSLLEFLDGRFAFVNERLAKHYGLPGVQGPEFRRVKLGDNVERAGILTQASILTLTSNPGRTSPVKRGKWIMETVLGTPPPAPPPNVPQLEESAKAKPHASLRQQLELHRANPSCAVCHTQMDSLGFALENFDAIGRHRLVDGEKLPIDASGTLPGNVKFVGPRELAKVLKQRNRDFRKSLTSQLLTYALGRGLERYDRCTVDEIAEKVQKQGDHFPTLVVEIVKSPPFRMRRGDSP